jgi:ABC-type nitrate/sulfonate/bicarbonate transport system ATPase subunit/ABC-type nitrate/sulfonate/bicarbonate transport system permease component
MAVSIPAGILTGLAAGLDKRAASFLRPLFSVIASTPVMAVILILFLVFGSGTTPVFASFLMVFPVMAANTIEGVRGVGGDLRELFFVYRMSRFETLRYLYVPSIAPFALGGLRSGLALAWKVVVAAEVLVQPLEALGTGMQRAKAQLETPELFAWTLATVIAAALSEGLLSLLIRRLSPARRPGRGVSSPFDPPEVPAGGEGSGPPPEPPEGPGMAVSLENLSFGFEAAGGGAAGGRRPIGGPGGSGVKDIFTRVSLTLGKENPAVLLGPSGCGKTTLLRLIGGLLEPLGGTIGFTSGGGAGERPPREGPGKAPGTAFVFQEPRLLPWMTALENAALPIKKHLGPGEARDRALHLFGLLGIREKASSYPGELSGGERQRVSMARAFAWPAPLLLMDEPFQSLDIPLRISLMDLTRDIVKGGGRLLIAVTHDPREAVYLGERIIVLGEGGVVYDRAPGPSGEPYGSPRSAALEGELIEALREAERGL